MSTPDLPFTTPKHLARASKSLLASSITEDFCKLWVVGSQAAGRVAAEQALAAKAEVEKAAPELETARGPLGPIRVYERLSGYNIVDYNTI